MHSWSYSSESLTVDFSWVPSSGRNSVSDIAAHMSELNNDLDMITRTKSSQRLVGDCS